MRDIVVDTIKKVYPTNEFKKCKGEMIIDEDKIITLISTIRSKIMINIEYDVDQNYDSSYFLNMSQSLDFPVYYRPGSHTWQKAKKLSDTYVKNMKTKGFYLELGSDISIFAPIATLEWYKVTGIRNNKIKDDCAVDWNNKVERYSGEVPIELIKLKNHIREIYKELGYSIISYKESKEKIPFKDHPVSVYLALFRSGMSVYDDYEG